MNQEFMEIQLNQHRCRKKTFQSPRGLWVELKNSGKSEKSEKRVWLWVELKKSGKKNSGKSEKRGWLRALTHDL